MDRATYEIEARVERQHWWFTGRRRILSLLLADLLPSLEPRARILDVGCGTGANGPVLAENGAFVVGLDASAVPFALAGTEERGHTVRLLGDAARLPFGNGVFDVVVALDVLEHLDDDAAALRELSRVARPGGALIIFVPALRVLWGLQDDVSHHRRRYGKQALVDVIEQAELKITRVTFFNSLLFPPILAARLAMRLWRPKGLKSENQLGGRLVNAGLANVFGLETTLLRHLDLPVGVSLAAVARK